MPLGFVPATTWVGVTAARVRMATARRTTRMSATTGVRMPTAANVRMSTATTGVRMPTAANVRMSTATAGIRVPTTTRVRVSTAEVTARVRSSSTGVAMRRTCARIAVRRTTTGSARMATPVVASYRMPTARRTMTFGTGTRMTSSTRTTTILGSMTARTSVMRYLVLRAAVRATSMRGNNAPSGELTRSRSGGHARSAVVKGRA
jgi:hypothetical protein